MKLLPLLPAIAGFAAIIACNSDQPHERAASRTINGSNSTIDARNDSLHQLDSLRKAGIPEAFLRRTTIEDAAAAPLDSSWSIRDIATEQQLLLELRAGMFVLRDAGRVYDTVASIDYRGDTYGQSVEFVGERFIVNEAVWRGNSGSGDLHMYAVRNRRFKPILPTILSHENAIMEFGEYSVTHALRTKPYRLELVEGLELNNVDEFIRDGTLTAEDVRNRRGNARTWSRRYSLRFDTSGVFSTGYVSLDNVPMCDRTGCARRANGRYPGVIIQQQTSVHIDSQWWRLDSAPSADDYTMMHYAGNPATMKRSGRSQDGDTLRLDR